MRPKLIKEGIVLLGVLTTLLGVFLAFRALQVLASRADDDPPAQKISVPPAPAKAHIPDTTIRTGQREKPPLVFLHRTPPAHPITARQMQLPPERRSLEYLIINCVVALLPLLLLLLTSMFYYQSRLPVFDPRDLDPAGLTALFEKCFREIPPIGNPRKIKRLSNKIRFQYHYLTLKGLSEPEDYIRLAEVLIHLETFPPAPTDDFDGFINTHHLNMPENLARHIEYLNRDSFS